MQQKPTAKAIYLLAGILVALVIVGALVLYAAGKYYKNRLDKSSLEKTGEGITLSKIKNVKKITLKKPGTQSCIEYTPDGVVRTYAICGGELTDISRLSNLNNLFKLFNLARRDLSGYYDKKDGTVYEIVIETDQGSETIYLVGDGTDGETGNQIVNTIGDIENDIPSPLPTPAQLPAPEASTYSSSPIPQPSSSGGSQPQSSPGSATGGTFACGFSETSQKKPVAVSNTICTTDPSPVP